MVRNQLFEILVHQNAKDLHLHLVSLLCSPYMLTCLICVSFAHYFSRADVSIIGIAGSSGSGKSTLSHAIVSKLNLPWVVILSMVVIPSIWLCSLLTLNHQDSFYKTLDEEGSRKAFRNEYDFDSPDAIDFDVLVERLCDLKAGYDFNLSVSSHERNETFLSTPPVTNL
jgi:hypothetical protein